MTTSAPFPRFAALDVLRGTAMAGMLLVTMPGDWAYTYPQFRHADWNGWTGGHGVPGLPVQRGRRIRLSFKRAILDASARAPGTLISLPSPALLAC